MVEELDFCSGRLLHAARVDKGVTGRECDDYEKAIDYLTLL